MLYSKEIHEKVILGILYMCLYIYVCVYYVFICMYIWSLKSINRNKKHTGNFLSFQTRTLLNTVWDFFFFLIILRLNCNISLFSFLQTFPYIPPTPIPSDSWAFFPTYCLCLNMCICIYMFIPIWSHPLISVNYPKWQRLTCYHMTVEYIESILFLPQFSKCVKKTAFSSIYLRPTDWKIDLYLYTIEHTLLYCWKVYIKEVTSYCVFIHTGEP